MGSRSVSGWGVSEVGIPEQRAVWAGSREVEVHTRGGAFLEVRGPGKTVADSH